MRKLLLATALSASFPIKALAVSTTLTTLAWGTWTDLGAGPFLNVGAIGPVVFAIADTTPSTITGGVGYSVPLSSAGLATTSHVWATLGDPSARGQAITSK